MRCPGRAPSPGPRAALENERFSVSRPTSCGSSRSAAYRLYRRHLAGSLGGILPPVSRARRPRDSRRDSGVTLTSCPRGMGILPMILHGPAPVPQAVLRGRKANPPRTLSASFTPVILCLQCAKEISRKDAKTQRMTENQIAKMLGVLASWREKRERENLSQGRKDAKRIENRIEKSLGVLASWREDTELRELHGQGRETLPAAFTGKFFSRKRP